MSDQISATNPWYQSELITVADEVWMWRAIELARIALDNDEIPFGCVIIGPEGDELAATWGTGTHDPLSHSEMVAIHMVAHHYTEPTWLDGCSLYSTHEPCVMCCGGINHAKISRVVWGSCRSDLPHLFSRKAAAELTLATTSHPPRVFGAVLRQPCIELFDGIGKWD